MEYKDIVSISGMGGLFKSETQRGDGMIVTSLEDKTTKFVPSRSHLFTPLESITIYTEEDTVDLYDVLQTIKKKADLAIPDAKKASGDDLKTYFKEILPEYDEERVYSSDIKKVIKWFGILDAHLDLTKDLEVEPAEVEDNDKEEEE